MLVAITLPDSPGTPSRPSSLADNFKPTVEPVPQNKTAVDTVEEFVGRPVQAALNSPLGIVINPAMQAINTVYKNTFEPALETASGFALEPEVARQNPNLSPDQVRRVARDYANDISLGQSLSRLPFEYTNLTSDALPEFMQEDFNILDQEERDLAYKSQFAGWAASSALDVGVMIGTEKGFGPVWRGAKGMALGRNTIKSAKDLEKYMLRLDKAEDYFNNGNTGPRSGDVRLIQQLIESNDPLKIAKNPLVANGSVANPDRAITILASLDDATSVINYLRAERGSRKALQDLWKAQPIAADSVDNFGVRFTPIEDMSQIHALPSVQRSQKLQAIYQDWTQKNPQFARAIDDFIAEVESGAGISTYASRQGLLSKTTGGRLGGGFDSVSDRFTVPRGMRKAASQFGFSESDGVFSRLYENGPFQRAVRVIYAPSRARRRAEINISNPRQMETAWQISSELNRIRALGTAEGARFKQNAIRRYMRAATDTERAAVFKKIEQGAMLRIARAYGVDGITESTRGSTLIKQMEEIYKGIDSRRTNIQRQSRDTGVWEDADAVLNVQVGPKLRSTEPSNITMLDLAGLERATIQNVRDAYKRSRQGGWKGKTKPSAASGARAWMGDFAYGAGQFFDMVNIFFSNNVLLRVAYIPPNVIIDPILRATMDTESLFMTRQLFPGLANSVYNNTRRVANGVYRARTWRSMKEAKKDLQSRVDEVNKKRKSVTNAEKRLEAMRKKGEDVANAEERLIKQRASLAQLEKKMERSRKEYLRYTSERGRRSKDRAAIGSGRQAVIRRRDGSPLPGLVAEDRRWEFEVDGQRYDVLDVEDPNVKGVRPYQTEYDGYNSFLAASRTSEARDRLRLRQGELEAISPTSSNWDSYIDAVTRLANRNFRNELDEVGGRILRGDSPESIRAYLDSPDGAEYRARILDLLKKDERTPEGLTNWLNDTIEQANMLFPDEGMRKTILSRDITVDEVGNYLIGRQNLPQVMGRKLEMQTKNWRDYTYRPFGNFQDAIWKGFGALETRISRAPLFRYYVREEMKLQIEAARRAGVKVDNSVVHDRIRQIAYRRSLARVENTMYSVRNLTNAGWMARYLMAFPQAFFNSQLVAARLLWKNPANALYYQSVFDMWDGFNPIVDDQGNEYQNISDVPNDVAVKIAFPMQDAAGPIRVLGGAFGKLIAGAEEQWYDKDGLGGTYINPRMMEFMVGDPSISWFANIALSSIVSEITEYPFIKKNGPEIAAWMRENLGDDVYERSIFYGGEPLESTRTLDGAINTAKKALTSGYQMSALNTANMALGVTEQGLFTGPNYASRISAAIKMDAEDAIRQGRDLASPDQVVKGAAFSEFIRSAVQFGWYPNIIVDTRTSALMRLASNLYEQYDDSDQVERELIRLVGIPGLAQLASQYEKTAGTPSSMKSVMIVKEEEQLLRDIERLTSSPEYAGFLFQSYGEEEDEYVGEARAALRTGKYPGTDEEFLRRRSANELQRAAMIRVGYADYDALKNWQAGKMVEWGITSTQKKRYTTSGLRAEYESRLLKLRENSAWNDSFNKRQEDFWYQLYPAMKLAVENDGFMERQSNRIPILPELRTWVENMGLLRGAYLEAVKGTGSTKDNTRAKDAMLEWHYTFVNNSSPEFQEFASRWLTLPEEDDRTTQLVGELMGVG